MKEQLKFGVLLALILGALALFVLAVAKLFGLVILILIAIVITTGIDPLVTRLQKWLSRPLATLLVMLLGILIIGGAISFLAETAISQALSFIHNTKLQERNVSLLVRASVETLFVYPASRSTGQQLAHAFRPGRRISLVNYSRLFGFLGTLFSFVIVFILAFFFTTYRQGIVYKLSQFIPPQYQPRVREVGHLIALQMGGWLRGQLTLAFIITTSVGIFMAIIGFPGYAILLGIIGGIGELIPTGRPLPGLPARAAGGAHAGRAHLADRHRHHLFFRTFANVRTMCWPPASWRAASVCIPSPPSSP